MFVRLLLMSVVLMGSVAHADSSNISVTVFVAECTDGIDNDGDLLIDYGSDPGCESFGDDDETDTTPVQCVDGVDNDGDSLIDYPADPGCDSSSDDSEVNLVPSSTGGGGGGGSSGPPRSITSSPMTSSVIVSGHAYPNSTVRVYLDGRESIRVTASSVGSFEATLPVPAGFHIVSVTVEDLDGNLSPFKNIPILLAANSRSVISNITPSPSLKVAIESDMVAFTGSALPNADIVLEVRSPEMYAQGQSDVSGRYRIELPTSRFGTGTYSARAYAQEGNLVAPFGSLVTFSTTWEKRAHRTGDVNGDGKVNLTDFSMLLFWFNKPLNNAMETFEVQDFNGDKKIDLRDFSILAYHWTG